MTTNIRKRKTTWRDTKKKNRKLNQVPEKHEPFQPNRHRKSLPRPRIGTKASSCSSKAPSAAPFPPYLHLPLSHRLPLHPQTKHSGPNSQCRDKGFHGRANPDRRSWQNPPLWRERRRSPSPPRSGRVCCARRQRWDQSWGLRIGGLGNAKNNTKGCG